MEEESEIQKITALYIYVMTDLRVSLQDLILETILNIQRWHLYNFIITKVFINKIIKPIIQTFKIICGANKHSKD